MNSNFDAPSGSLMLESFDRKTIRELVNEESKLMVYKSTNGLAPKYLRNLFLRNSVSNLNTLRNTATDFRISKKRSKNGQKSFSFRGAKLLAGLPVEKSRHPLFVSSKMIFYERRGPWKSVNLKGNAS